MTIDLNRGITAISYDINQRPRSVVFDSGASTSYLYSTDGMKLQTRHRTPTISPAESKFSEAGACGAVASDPG